MNYRKTFLYHVLQFSLTPPIKLALPLGNLLVWIIKKIKPLQFVKALKFSERINNSFALHAHLSNFTSNMFSFAFFHSKSGIKLT